VPFTAGQQLPTGVHVPVAHLNPWASRHQAQQPAPGRLVCRQKRRAAHVLGFPPVQQHPRFHVPHVRRDTYGEREYTETFLIQPPVRTLPPVPFPRFNDVPDYRGEQIQENLRVAFIGNRVYALRESVSGV
jgi:hypothetical protein